MKIRSAGRADGQTLGPAAAAPSRSRETPVQIHPSGKGWKKFSKLPGKLYGKPKRSGSKKGAGAESISVLLTQETVQAVADFEEVIRCQFAAAANALGP